PRPSPGRAIQRADVAGRAGVDAAQVERSDPQARHQEVHDQDRPGADEEAGRGPAAAGARAETRSRDRSRTTQRAPFGRRMRATTELRIAVGEREGEVPGPLLRPASARALYVPAHAAGAGMRHPFLEQIAGLLAERGMGTVRYQFPYMERRASRTDAAPVGAATTGAVAAYAGSD